MRWTYVLCATALVVSLIPTTAAGDALCTPVADPSAEKISDRYLRKTYDGYDVWRETNNIPGLQLDSEMACGAPADFQWIVLGASGI